MADLLRNLRCEVCCFSRDVYLGLVCVIPLQLAGRYIRSPLGQFSNQQFPWRKCLQPVIPDNSYVDLPAGDVLLRDRMGLDLTMYEFNAFDEFGVVVNYGCARDSD